MIIICNGLYKSGSTYIHTALRLALNPTGVPEGVTLSTLNTKNPNFTKVNLDRCSDLTEEVTVFKTHNYHTSVLKDIGARKDVLIIFTNRPTSEILFSHYHHFSNERFKIPFYIYLLSVGVIKIIEVELYRKSIYKLAARLGDQKFIEIYFSDLFGNISDVIDRITLSDELKKFKPELTSSFDTAYIRAGDKVESITGMRGREWFVRRDTARRPSRLSKALVDMFVFFVRLVLRLRSVSHLFLGILAQLRRQKSSYFGS
jgi:hypothetical protein